jgi:uncharacterized lipoprotein YmbA
MTPRPLAPLLAAALLAGCSLLPAPRPDTTRHFLLEGTAPAAAPAPGAPRVGLRRVEVPVYLRGRAMVVRSGGNETRVLPEARWAEPFEAGLARVLRDRLAAGVAVHAQPFPAAVERDYDVSVVVSAAEGGDDGVRFAATFEVVRPSDGAVVARRAFVAPVTPWEGDPARLTAQLSVAAAALATEVLAALPPR